MKSNSNIMRDLLNLIESIQEAIADNPDSWNIPPDVKPPQGNKPQNYDDDDVDHFIIDLYGDDGRAHDGYPDFFNSHAEAKRQAEKEFDDPKLFKNLPWVRGYKIRRVKDGEDDQIVDDGRTLSSDEVWEMVKRAREMGKRATPDLVDETYKMRMEEQPMGQAWLESLETTLEIDCGMSPDEIRYYIQQNVDMIEERFANGEDYEDVAVTICELAAHNPRQRGAGRRIADDPDNWGRPKY